MRIVGGRARGTALVAPKGMSTRPTTDRTRERLFNILAHGEGLEGKRVLDLFAGSGALGLEAISRGAAFALFVETDHAARAAIRKNAEATRVLGQSRVWQRDATRLGDATVAPFDLVFADPPYGHGLGEAALASLVGRGWLKVGALAVLEERTDAAPEVIDGWVLEDRRDGGDTALTFWRLANGVSALA